MSGAGCPRVTHPFAALPPEGLPLQRFPLDLHVLSTPPAFVLSQDQTLRREPSDPEPEGPGLSGSLESRLSPEGTSGSASCDSSCYDRQRRRTRRTAPPLRRGCALAFSTLFSSQGARTRPRSARRVDSEEGVAPTDDATARSSTRQPDVRSARRVPRSAVPLRTKATNGRHDRGIPSRRNPG